MGEEGLRQITKVSLEHVTHDMGVRVELGEVWVTALVVAVLKRLYLALDCCHPKETCFLE